MADVRPTEVQRLELGFSSPIPEEKEIVWSFISIPQAGISREHGGYQPAKIFRHAHFHPARTVLVAGGPRSGKSLFGSMETVTWTPHSDLIWLAADSYDLARQEFEYTAEALLSLNWTEPRLISFPENRYQPCAVETIWGTLIETKSLKDANTFVARAPDLVDICEPGLTSLTSLHRANERLTTRRGKLLLPGTFEEAAPWLQQYWRKWVQWPNVDNAKSYSAPSWVNRIVFPKGLKDPETDKLRAQCDTMDEFLLRFTGVPSASADIIFSDSYKMREHIRPCPYDRFDGTGSAREFRPVMLAIDPGYSGDSRYVVLAIQVYPKEKVIRIIDEVVAKGESHEQVIHRCRVREWWPVARDGVMDPYAGDSHVYGGPAPASVWREDGTPPQLKQYHVNIRTPKRLLIDDLIRHMKGYFTGANGWRLQIDPRCERLQEELMGWRRIRTPNGLGIPMKAKCDAIKALGYFLTDHWTNQYAGSEAPYQVRDYGIGTNIGGMLAGRY